MIDLDHDVAGLLDDPETKKRRGWQKVGEALSIPPLQPSSGRRPHSTGMAAVDVCMKKALPDSQPGCPLPQAGSDPRA